MAWALVAHAVSGNTDGANGPFRAPTGSGSVNTTGADLYVVVVACYAVLVATDMSDSGGAGYSMLAVQAAVGDTSQRVYIFYKAAPTTSATEHWTLGSVTAAYAGVCAAAFSGSNASQSPGSTRSGTTTSTPQAGSLGIATDLVVCGAGNYTRILSSIDSGFSITDQNNYVSNHNMGTAMAWCNLSGGIAGAVNPTWTYGGAGTQTSVAVIAANFAIASGGGGGVTLVQLERQMPRGLERGAIH